MPGTYRFKWPHSADEVYVTGTFDNWSKSIKLDNKGWVHEKTVEIPDTKDEILYKFVVNGQWRTDPSHAVKRDHEGNENNILDHDDIIPSAIAGAATIATVGAGATTLGLAGKQPIEEKSIPGAFPETPMESAGVPTLQDQVVGVNPIPATAGIGNPVQLQPGEKVPDPSTLTGNTIGSTATTDKASYEAGANGAAYAPAGKADDSAAHFGRPAAGGVLIPESGGLPMGDGSKPTLTQKDYTDPTLSSVGAGATTAGLAGQQPIEPRGTPTVEKKDDGIAGKAAAGAAVAGVAVAGAAVAANEIIKDKTGKDPVSALPQSAQNAIHENAKESNLPAQATGADRETASSVPKEVTESQKEANRPPEAAANEAAIQEKSEAEKELLSKVPESNAQGEPAPTTTAATTTTAPTTTSETGAPQLGHPTAGGLAPINLDDKPSDANVAALKATQNTPQHPRATSGVAEGTTSTTSTPQKRHSLVDRLRTPKSEAGSSEPSTPTSKKRESFLKRMKEKIKNL